MKLLTPVLVQTCRKVVPLAGTWIEIEKWLEKILAFYVVPLAGTWIEIIKDGMAKREEICRPPRGDVD